MRKFGLLTVIALMTMSCAKEIYTDADATKAQREAQKTGLTVMVRDINDFGADLSGFVVVGSQCGEEINGTTSAEGLVDLKVIRGDVILSVKKDGYVTATIVVTTNVSGTERNNTVVAVPVFVDAPASGTINGTVSAEITPLTEEPVSDALVRIDPDADELMHSVFSGLAGGLDQFKPAALYYTSTNVMQPVRTGTSGEFRLFVPATGSDVTYTINVQKTNSHVRYSAAGKVVTNGRDNRTISFQLTSYEN